MKNFSRAMVLAGIVLLANTEGGFAKEMPTKPPINYAVEANRDFGLDLYRQLAKENEGKNLFFSPYSMSVALAMTAEGPGVKRPSKMGKVLHFPKEARRIGADADWIPWNNTLIDAGLAGLNERYNAQKQCELRVANALWGEKTIPSPSRTSTRSTNSTAPAACGPVDFFHNAEAARELINAWAEKQTHERIKDLIPPGAVDRDTCWS